jgi:putative endonuclease
LGERRAEDYLVRERGFKRVARNWRNPADRREEIDLVMKDGEVLVFVEVKTRAQGALVSGYHAVDERKRRVLRRAVRAYLRGMTERPPTHRFDIVEVAWPVEGSDAEPELHHFERVPLGT